MAKHKSEVVNTLKKRFPDFPNAVLAIAEFISAYPNFVSNLDIISEEVEVNEDKYLMQEMIAYKKGLKMSMESKIDSIFNAYINKGNIILSVKDRSLLDNYKAVVKEDSEKMFNDKIQLNLGNNNISYGKFILEEMSIMDTVKSLAYRVSDVVSRTFR